MSDRSNGSPRNRLLRAISADDLAAVKSRLHPVALEQKQSLATPNEPVESVYFPETGVASVVARTQDGRGIEVGLFGREGMSAPSLLLGVDRTPYDSFIQLAGEGLRIDAADFVAWADERPAARSVFLRYAQAYAVQTAQTALANGAFNIQERLARWLLMCHDRMDGPELPLTHEFLGLMLGVRRSSVTVALQTLEAAALIRARRGLVVVLERGKLEAVAGDSYGSAEAEYARLLGAPK